MRLSFIFILISFSLLSQKQKPENYNKFDQKLFHFGFMLGGNTADFGTFIAPDAYNKYGLKSISNRSAPGGQIGIVSTMKVGTPVVRLRLIPTISFQERILDYRFEGDTDSDDDDYFNTERPQATNLDFPLMFQFRTLRLNNFAAYFLLGNQYTMDLQSQAKAAQDYLDPFLKLKKHDMQGQVGAGIEFFAPFFKFGMEIKYSHSYTNVLINDNTVISKPLDRLYNKVIWFSLIFEG